MGPALAEAATRLRRWRHGLVAGLSGDILEIGVGMGENLPYYQRGARLFAIEPDATRAGAAARLPALLPASITVQVAVAEQLPYPPHSFDHVVSSLVFCSVTEPRIVLCELERVLKPGGCLHLVEHVRPENRLLGRLFAAVTPSWRRMAYNCHLDRETVTVLRDLGWQVTILRRRAIFLRMTAQPAARPADGPPSRRQAV